MASYREKFLLIKVPLSVVNPGTINLGSLFNEGENMFFAAWPGEGRTLMLFRIIILLNNTESSENERGDLLLEAIASFPAAITPRESTSLAQPRAGQLIIVLVTHKTHYLRKDGVDTLPSGNFRHHPQYLEVPLNPSVIRAMDAQSERLGNVIRSANDASGKLTRKIGYNWTDETSIPVTESAAVARIPSEAKLTNHGGWRIQVGRHLTSVGLVQADRPIRMELGKLRSGIQQLYGVGVIGG